MSWSLKQMGVWLDKMTVGQNIIEIFSIHRVSIAWKSMRLRYFTDPNGPKGESREN